MLTKRIIPCLDVAAGRVVKGVRFTDLVDAGDPVTLAQAYAADGADEIVLLDITASRDGRGTLIDLAARAARGLTIPFTVGGGVRTVDDIRLLLAAGADKITINTAAVEDPSLLAAGARAFGAQCMVLAIDAKADPTLPSGWRVYTHGGHTPTSLDAIAWAREAEREGAGEILLTSMDRDGTHDGYDLELTAAVVHSVSIPVIASGGVGSLDHLRDGLLIGGAEAVLAASIFHYGESSIAEAKSYLASHGIPVRPCG